MSLGMGMLGMDEGAFQPHLPAGLWPSFALESLCPHQRWAPSSPSSWCQLSLQAPLCEPVDAGGPLLRRTHSSYAWVKNNGSS